ncbi:hypothetical protein [Rurimicrobium arvi]|uniref:Uncharacterized protein n=1 Tax=Rurimicrobium arvi TaxID=2049916 RepID=A0ABP8MRS7_9BACT
MSQKDQKNASAEKHNELPKTSFVDAIITLDEFNKRKRKYHVFRTNPHNTPVIYPDYIRFDIDLLQQYLSGINNTVNSNVDIHFGIDDLNRLTLILVPASIPPSDNNCYDQGEVHPIN